MLPPVAALGERAFALIAHFHVFYHDVTLRGVAPHAGAWIETRSGACPAPGLKGSGLKRQGWFLTV